MSWVRIAARRGTRAAAAALLWLAAACGPSTGGTGTGTGAPEYGLDFFDATAQPLCAAPFARALACPGAAASDPAAAPGSGPLAFTDAAGRVVAVIEGNRLRLDSRCQRLVFEGVWASNPALGSRFFGAYTLTDGPDLFAATVAVALAGDGSSLEIVLRGADDAVVLGPLTLARGAVPAPTCP
jgi:hypothetical protein